MEGWIKLYRSVSKHWIWSNPRYFKWWLDLLLMANFEPTDVLVGSELYHCNPGEMMTSYSFLSHRWNVSKSVVSRYLKLLESDTMIERKRERHATRIIVCNYELYQGDAETERTKKEREKNDFGTIMERKKNENGTKKERIKECIRTKERKERKEKETKQSNDCVCSETHTHEEESEFFLEFFNSCVAGRGIRKIIDIKGRRLVSLNARIRDYGRDAVMEMIKMAAESDFLNGEGKDGWTADFDWLMRPMNFKKVVDGNYKNKDYGKSKGKEARDDSGLDSRKAESDRRDAEFKTRKKGGG